MTVAEPTTLTRAADLRKQLESKIMVADGAMGTMLYSKGIFINRCFDELNLSSPQLVRDIHQEYVRSGAEILETNTFGSNNRLFMYPDVPGMIYMDDFSLVSGTNPACQGGHDRISQAR